MTTSFSIDAVPTPRPARARVWRVRCWPLWSVPEPWHWYAPAGDGYYVGSASSHAQTLDAATYYAGCP